MKLSWPQASSSNCSSSGSQSMSRMLRISDSEAPLALGCASRREMVKRLGALAGGMAVNWSGVSSAADAPPETSRIRLMKASLCTAPAYVAEPLLHAEGFENVQYLDDDQHEIGTSKLIATGAADLNMSFGLTTLIRVDAGEPVVMLAGLHAGCYELFANEGVQSIRDLRGRKVG